MYMKLYLSSFRLGNYPEKLLELLPQKPRAGVIISAKDKNGQLERSEKLRGEISILGEIGIEADEIDLRNYFNGETGLRETIAKYDLLWVAGGNVFLLRKAMAYSGADKIINDLVRSDEIVYGGYSAGACVLAPTLRGIELCDPVDQPAAGYEKETIWDGLQLVSYSVASHYKSDHPETSMIDDVVEFFANHKMPYKTLRDGEVIVVNGDKETLYGLG